MMKSTYGTGYFAILNTGRDAVASRNWLLPTIAYRLGSETVCGLEGEIFVAGAAVQWLRDGLRIVPSAGATGAMAAAADPSQEVVMVLAFVGLGAPHGDAEAGGALFGLTRSAGPNEFARAALESVCFQTLDLVDAMRADCGALADTVARPIWPGCNRVSIRIHRLSRLAGRTTAASPPPWMKRHPRERSPLGSTPSAARWAAMTLRARHRMPAVHLD
jgi:hypothetical protein